MTRTPVDIDKPWHKSIPFSQGVVAEGKFLFTSGVTSRDDQGGVVGVGDMRRQMEKCFENLGDVLKAAGAEFGDVVKFTMYTTDIDAYRAHADVYRNHFINRPASTLIEISKLADPEMMVEIEAVVRLP